MYETIFSLGKENITNKIVCDNHSCWQPDINQVFSMEGASNFISSENIVAGSL